MVNIRSYSREDIWITKVNNQRWSMHLLVPETGSSGRVWIKAAPRQHGIPRTPRCGSLGPKLIEATLAHSLRLLVPCHVCLQWVGECLFDFSLKLGSPVYLSNRCRIYFHSSCSDVSCLWCWSQPGRLYSLPRLCRPSIYVQTALPGQPGKKGVSKNV